MNRRLAIQILILLIALVLYAWLPIWTIYHALNNNDFKHLYLGMKALLDGISPYSFQALHHQGALQGYPNISLNPYVYLPFTGHVMSILAPFTLDQAVTVWFCLNHLFLLSSIALISDLFPKWRIGAMAVMIAAISLNTPLYRTLTAGQLNLALLLMITLAWYLSRHGCPYWSGAIMAFAALFKLMPGLYGFYFLLRRQWKAFFAMAISGLVMLALSVSFGGPKVYMEFFSVLKQMGYGKSTWPQVFSFWDDPPNQSLNSFFSHIFTISDHTIPWLSHGQQMANIATIIVALSLTLVYTYTQVRNCAALNEAQYTPKDNAAWGSTLILALLIPSLMWDHYLVMLLLPIAIMIHMAVNMKRWPALLLVIVCYIITSIPWNFEALPWRQGLGIFAMSLKLWPTLILFGLSLCFTQWADAESSPPSRD